MDETTKPTCHIVRPESTYDGKQGLSYFAGIAAETVGSKGICMHLLTIPPGGRAKAHRHESHETAIYMLSGEAHTWYGDRLEHHVIVKAGELFYIRPACRTCPPTSRTSRPAPSLPARTRTSRRAWC